MATKYFTGKATAVAQVTTVQVTAYDAATTYILTCGGQTASAVGEGTVNATATALAVAWNASTHVYLSGVTASAATDTVTLTADLAGLPFVVTSSVSGGAGTIGAATNTTENAGPNDVSSAGNWSDNAAPTADDFLIAKHCDVNLCWGFDQSAVGLEGLDIHQSHTGRIGLDYRQFATSIDGETTSTAAEEYRDCYWKVKLNAGRYCRIGIHDGPDEPIGSGRIMLDFGSDNAALVDIHNTASSSIDTYRPAIRLLADHADTEIHVRNVPGGVGLATEVPDESAEVGLITVADKTATGSIYVGTGAVAAAYVQYGGDNYLYFGGTIAAVTTYGGLLVLEGQSAGPVACVTTLTIEDGAHVIDRARRYGGAVHVTTCNHNGGTLDLTQRSELRKYGTYNWRRGAILIVNPDTLTFDTAFNLPSGPSTLTAA